MKARRGGSIKGSRPNNGGARKKVRDDDGRGGVRSGAGRKPDLVGVVQGVSSSLTHHQHKFSPPELRELQDATGALLQQIRMLLPEAEEWNEAEVL